jgi:hypothetical protein
MNNKNVSEKGYYESLELSGNMLNSIMQSKVIYCERTIVEFVLFWQKKQKKNNLPHEAEL